MNETAAHGVACPRCKALAGDPCRTRNGSVRRSRPHLERKASWAARLTARAQEEFTHGV